MKLATLCYIKKDGKTLMLYRNKKENDMHEGFYNGIGGKFEPGETPEECAIREIKEEVGLNVEELKYKGLIVFPNHDPENAWYVFVYRVEKFDGELIDCNEGTLEWVDDDKLLDLKTHAGDKVFMPWLNKDNIFSAKFVYNGEELINYSVQFY